MARVEPGSEETKPKSLELVRCSPWQALPDPAIVLAPLATPSKCHAYIQVELGHRGVAARKNYRTG